MTSVPARPVRLVWPYLSLSCFSVYLSLIFLFFLFFFLFLFLSILSVGRRLFESPVGLKRTCEESPDALLECPPKRRKICPAARVRVVRPLPFLNPLFGTLMLFLYICFLLLFLYICFLLLIVLSFHVQVCSLRSGSLCGMVIGLVSFPNLPLRPTMTNLHQIHLMTTRTTIVLLLGVHGLEHVFMFLTNPFWIYFVQVTV